MLKLKLKKVLRQAGALTVALSILLSLGVIGAGATYTRFADVAPVYALAGEIEEAASRGLVSGYSDGTFRPDLPLSRGAFCKMMALAFADKGYTLPITTARYNGVFARYAAFIETRSKELGNYDATLAGILNALSEPATRRDAIVVMAAVTERGIMTAGYGTQNYDGFSDADAALMALIDRINGGVGLRGVVSGFADKTVRAENVLKRSYGVAYAVRYGNLRIEPQGEYEESYEVKSTNGKTAAELRSTLLGMSFSDSAFADILGKYLFATGFFTNGVTISVTHGGEFDGMQIVRGDAGSIISISVYDGTCESFRAAGRRIIGVTAPTSHATVSDLLREVEGFCDIQPPIDPTPVVNMKAYVGDDNIVYFWLDSVPFDTKRVEFTVRNTMYTVFSDAENGELGGYTNLFDSFAIFNSNLGDADCIVQWNADENTAFVGENGAIIAQVLAYNNDYKETATIETTIYTTDGIMRLNSVELVIPVCDFEPEPMPGFTSLSVFVEGRDLTANVYNLTENAEIIITTFGGFGGISLGTQRIPVGPTGNGGFTAHIVLDEIEAMPGNYHWVSLVDEQGDDLVEPFRIDNVLLGDYDNFTVGVSAA